MVQKSIGIGKDYSFGVELEFTNAPLKKVESALQREDIPFIYQLQHKSYHPTYQDWILDVDGTVTKVVNHEFIGGELSSRILQDDEVSWDELQRVCQLLRKEKATTTSRTSTHITVDIERFKNNPYFFEALCKIICVYEQDMALFFMGDEFLLRKTKGEYAANMDHRLRRTMRRVDFSQEDFLDRLVHQTDCFQLRDGISFYKLLYKGLMEVRYPNGTLREETIQNEVSFVLRLLKAIEEEKFDLDYLDSVIQKDMNSPFEVYRIFQCIEDPDRFFELADLIGDEQGSFVKQYQKVLESRNKKRSS